jgi:hypothetical protein
MDVFAPQVHKVKRGYYINHGLLMALDPAARSRAITYFIAMNTPNKLDPQDRYLISDSFESNCRSSLGKYALLGATLFALAVRGKYRLLAPFAGSLIYNFEENRREQKMIFNSDLVKDIALKYNFSIFDFHNSKKESQYRAFRDTIFKEYRLYGSAE